MKTVYSILIPLTLVWLGLFACVTDYQPDNRDSVHALIVDGLITDQPGPYTVSLRFTSKYSFDYLNLLATGYTLFITDSNGQSQPMREVNQGIYETSNIKFQGQIGQVYQLHIVSPTGKKYESTLEHLSAVSPITRLYWQYQEQNRVGTSTKDKGFNVYLDTQDPDTLGNHYRWRWLHYESTEICDFVNGLYTPCCTVPCWSITRCTMNNCLHVLSDVAINSKQISGQFIMKAPYESRSKYYLEVEQQSLSRLAYQYWYRVNQQVNQSGGIFDAAPASIRGNIVCTSDSTELVFGYFGASGSISSPLLIDRSLAPSNPDAIEYPVAGGSCTPCNETVYHTPRKPRWWPN